MADVKKLLAAANKGDVDAIWEIAGADIEVGDDDDEEVDTSEADELAYKWLLISADFGHEAAEEAADDMLETSSFRYDDGQLLQGCIELELGEAYLTGEDGLPVNLEHAATHLEQAKALDVHNTTDVAKGFSKLRKKLSAEALAVFDAVFPEKPTTRSKPIKPTDPPPKPKRPV